MKPELEHRLDAIKTGAFTGPKSTDRYAWTGGPVSAHAALHNHGSRL